MKKIPQPHTQPRNEPSVSTAHSNGLSLEAPTRQDVFIQARLQVGAPNDAYEKQADRMADYVIQRTQSGSQKQGSVQRQPNIPSVLPSPAIQPKCEKCEQEERLRRKEMPGISSVSSGLSGGMAAPDHISRQLESTSGGRPLSRGTRAEMEGVFGTDFGGVRVHENAKAVQMSRELNAQAFTVGNDIYFNEGKYNPSSGSGKHLLAHELTHTLQQEGISRKIQKQDEDEKEKEEHSLDYNLLPPEIKWRISSFLLFADTSNLKMDYDADFFIKGLRYKYGGALSLLMQHNGFKMDLGVVPQTPELKLGATYNDFYLGSSYNFNTSSFGLNLGWGAKPLPYNNELIDTFGKAGNSAITLIGNAPMALQMPPWGFYAENKDDIGNITKGISTIKKITDDGKKDIRFGGNFNLSYNPVSKLTLMVNLTGRF